MKLNDIQSTNASRKNRKRLGCGIATGQGKTGGRGHKGQKCRSGGKIMRGFEGGQMPLIRRVPKRGFTPLSRKEFQIINVGQLDKFKAGSKVDAAKLFEAGLVRNAVDPIKLLATGELSKKLTLTVSTASSSAKAKLEAAGGSLALTEGE